MGTKFPPVPVTSCSRRGTAPGPMATTIQPFRSPKKSRTGAVMTMVSTGCSRPSTAESDASETETSSSAAFPRSFARSSGAPRSPSAATPQAPPGALRTRVMIRSSTESRAAAVIAPP